MKHFYAVEDIIREERERQVAKFESSNIPIDCANPLAPGQVKLGVLVEEVGEVAKALIEDSPSIDLFHEIIQVAAVAHAWAEAVHDSLDKELTR
jgi:hypothetical protein